MNTRTARTLLWVAVIGTAIALLPNRIASRAGAEASLQQAPRGSQGQSQELSGQTVTLLPDGRWLAIGGRRGNQTVGTIAVVDADTGRGVSAGVSLVVPRSGHSATVL
ncbi:MAG: hypothetical protein ACRD2A_21635, partial [Vicinamibacterales bacterium]